MESKNYSKLVNKTKKNQTHKERTTGYQWGKEEEKGSIGVGGKRVIMGLYETMCETFENIKHYKMKSFIQLKRIVKKM